MRASDQMYDIGMVLGGRGQEDRHRQHTLRSLQAHLGAAATPGYAPGISMTAAPIRMIARPFRRGG
jgi:hypothetical protein